MSPLRVHLADSDHFSRAGISGVLAAADDIVLEQSYNSMQDAVAGTKEHRPDIVLLEESLRGSDLHGAIGQITTNSPETKVVMLAVKHHSEDISKAHDAGSSGYIAKHTIDAELPSALRMVAAGYSVFAQPSDEEVFPARSGKTMERSVLLKALSDRDRRLVSLVAFGMTNMQIAKAMHISEGSVKLYLARLMEKFKIANRVQLAVIASEIGLISSSDLSPN